MPAVASSQVLSPAAVVARFGRRSALAKSFIKELADERTQLPEVQLPQFPVNLVRLERSPAMARWQRELGADGVPRIRVVTATQVYTLLVIHWLAESVLRQRGFAGGTESAFVPAAILELANHPPPHLSALVSAASAAADFSLPSAPSSADYFKAFYQDLVPREVRHALGEYYTPDWLAEHLLNLLAEHAGAGGRWLDPSCGSGTFLLQVLARKRSTNPWLSLQELLDSVAGIDLHPLAVAAARFNYLLAILDLVPEGSPLPRLPVYQADTILQADALRQELGRFDVIVGNPPWVGWEALSPAYREATRPQWIEQGLFPHRGMSAILGSGKKDLSLLLSQVVSDQLLAERGWLGFLTTQAAFKTSAGAGFRRFAVGQDCTPVRVAHVEDLSAVQPFPGASNRTVLFLWQKGQTTTYPLPYLRWSPAAGKSARLPAEAPLAVIFEQVQREHCSAQPAKDAAPTSTWLTMPAADLSLKHLVGPSDYRAHEGANTGGANAVYWLQCDADSHESNGGLKVRNITAGAKRAAPEVTAELETQLLYPLLRGSDVRRWTATPSAWLLLVQDPITRCGIDAEKLRSQCPRTFAYLAQFEEMLRERAAYKRYFQRAKDNGPLAAPFYSMFDVGTYTLSPCKVVWHRMLAPIQAAVVETSGGKPIVPQETLAFIPCESPIEGHYLAGLLNSEIFNRAAAAYAQTGGKSFASPHLLQHLRLPRFEPTSTAHQAVAEESQKLAQERQRPVDQSRLDELAAAVWSNSQPG